MSFSFKKILSGVLLLPLTFGLVHAMSAQPGADDLELWLAADVAVTGTTAVSQWDDQSGNNNHVVQNTANKQPSLNVATSSMNFHQSIEFDAADGIQNYLQSSNIMNDDNDDMTFFIVFNSDASSGAQNQLFGMGSDFDRPHVGFKDTGEPSYSNKTGIPLFKTTKYFEFSANQKVPYANPLLFSGSIDDQGFADTRAENYINGLRNENSPTIPSGNHLGTNDFALGGAGQDFDGRIAEVLIYNALLPDALRQQVESYLAIKYGLTLTNAYLNSAANIVYAADATYNNNIVGLAKDADGSLDQRISRSVDDDSGLILSTDVNFTNSNSSHSDILADKDFILLGHDNGSAIATQTSELSAGFDKRLIREWKVQNTNSVTAINLNFGTLPALTTGESYVLIGNSDGDFSTGNTALQYSNNGIFSSVTFPTGTSYYTIAIITNKIEFTQPSGTDNENTGGNLPAIAILGYFPTTTAVTLNLTGTATNSTDYTTPTLSIPAGVYDGLPAGNISLTNFSITNDALGEIDETAIVTLDIGAITDFVVGDANNDTATQNAFTYTIIDEDISVAASGSLLVATDNNALAGNIDTGVITLQLKETDGDDIAISGISVTFSIPPGTATFGNSSNTFNTITDAAGLATASVKSPIVESVNVTATIDRDIDGGTTPEEAVINGSPVNINFVTVLASGATSTIAVSPATLTTDGGATSTITIQARDTGGSIINSSAGIVTLAEDSAAAVVSSVTDNNNGTYTATITNTKAEVVTISAIIDGNNITSGDQTITFTVGAVSAATTSIAASSPTVTADGATSSTITVQAKDAQGNDFISSGGIVTLAEDSATAILSSVTNNNNGTYTATITNTVAETVIISGSIASNAITSGNQSIAFIPGAPSPATTTMSATPSVLRANGSDTSTITIQAIDALGNLLTSGGDTVEFISNNSAVINNFNDNSNGTYTATVTNSEVETTTITAKINTALITSISILTFVENGPAQVNASDGQFINGTAPAGTTITIKDSDGIVLCSTVADASTGAYHCVITAELAEGEILTVITTDLAGNDETSAITVTLQDSDNDGISDVIESLLQLNNGSSDTSVATDTDNDQLPDYAEVILGSDYLSINSPVTNGNIDTDTDGVADSLEYFFNELGGATDTELSTDTDADGLPDITELHTNHAKFYNANNPTINGAQDDDLDSLTNAVEAYLEFRSIDNLTLISDYDNDGYSDALEVRLASNPLFANEKDDDNDGVNNAIEAFLTGTTNDSGNTVLNDRDTDELPDIFELSVLTDLSDPASEINDSNSGDTDSDGITDAVEVYLYGNTTEATTSSDQDFDGTTDITEVLNGSNPLLRSKPSIWIDYEQSSANNVTLLGNIAGFQSPPPTLSWDLSDILAKQPDAVVSYPTPRTIQINGLSIDVYTIELTETRLLNSVELSSPIRYSFKVKASAFNDADFDAVPDEYDQYDGLTGKEESIHTTLIDTSRYDLQTSYGHTAKLGEIARLANNGVSNISATQIEEMVEYGYPITMGTPSAPQPVNSTANIFDFELANFAETGGIGEVVIPLHNPIPESPILLRFDINSSLWATFDTSEQDVYLSSLGSEGLCPPPGSNLYTAGLTPGQHCLYLRIADGGNNDSDKQLNGAIKHLSAIGSGNTFPEGATAIDNPASANPLAGIPIESNLLESNPLKSNTLENGISQDSSNTLTSSPDASGTSSGGSFDYFILALLSFFALSFASTAKAAPIGGSIAHGNGNISTSIPNQTIITQDSSRLAIDWQSFNIAENEGVTFIQPNGSSIVLNRDFSGSPSQLFGSINANGQVLILNSAGILIGETASINVGSFLASDMETTIEDFSQGDFTLLDNNISEGGITNLGTINSTGNGGVYITGQFISNSGAISSSNGDIHLATANEMIVSTGDNGLIGVQLTQPLTSDISPSGDLIYNNGDIVSINGNIYLDLYYSDTIKANTVNNEGLINAIGITEGNGEIFLTATPEVITPIPNDINLIPGAIDNNIIIDSGLAIDITLEAQPAVSIDSIMPECDTSTNSDEDCNKYKAIKQYLSRLLLGGELPE